MRTKPCGYKDIWFAWYPVRLGYSNNGPYVWLEKVIRQKSCHYIASSPWYSYWSIDKDEKN